LLAVERFERREEKMGAGRAVFMKDQKPRKIRYKKSTDDGVKRLHLARFNPLPTGNPHDWADQNPVKREQVMKNLYMTHYGVGHGQVDTKTIVKVRADCYILCLTSIRVLLQSQQQYFNLRSAYLNWSQ
jgi:hypothetical protein